MKKLLFQLTLGWLLLTSCGDQGEFTVEDYPIDDNLRNSIEELKGEYGFELIRLKIQLDSAGNYMSLVIDCINSDQFEGGWEAGRAEMEIRQEISKKIAYKIFNSTSSAEQSKINFVYVYLSKDSGQYFFSTGSSNVTGFRKEGDELILDYLPSQ